jgi:hypothetical protein
MSELFKKQFQELVNEFSRAFDISNIQVPEDPIEFYLNNIAKHVASGEYWGNDEDEFLPGITFSQVRSNPYFDTNRYVIEKYLKTLYLVGYEDMKKFLGDERVDYVRSSVYNNILMDMVNSKTQEQAQEQPRPQFPTTGEGMPDNMEDFIKNSSVGKLAEDIMKDIELPETPPENPMEMMSTMLPSVMKSITGKMQSGEIDFNKIQQESMGMMKTMGPMMQAMAPMMQQMMNPQMMQQMAQAMGGPTQPRTRQPLPQESESTENKKKTKKTKKKRSRR